MDHSVLIVTGTIKYFGEEEWFAVPGVLRVDTV